MVIKGAFEKAKHYINSHSTEVKNTRPGISLGPCITISRQTGAGAEIISQHIVDIFSQPENDHPHPWTIFDQNLIEKVLKDHHLPQQLSNIMEEKKYSAVHSIMNELIGGHPGTWTLFHKTTETILQLAHIGYSIIVERGGNIVTAKMDNTLHIRVVAAIEDRIKHVQEVYNLNRKESNSFIENEDENRKEYVETYFHKNIEDPTLYHLILNSSEITHGEAAELISKAIMSKMPEYFSNMKDPIN